MTVVPSTIPGPYTLKLGVTPDVFPANTIVVFPESAAEALLEKPVVTAALLTNRSLP